MFKIAKEFSFDMAHMLNGYDEILYLFVTFTEFGLLYLRAYYP